MPPFEVHSMGTMSIDLTNVRSAGSSIGFAQHRIDEYFGEWLMEPGRFRALFGVAMQTDLAGHMRSGDAQPTSLDERIRIIPGRSGGRSGDGVAVIPVSGTLMKHVSSLSRGTSLVHLQKALRDVARNGEVGAVILEIDSPGGTVAGTFETVGEVVNLAAKKPVIAFCRDLTASAAYAIASNATSIYANVNTALVGSIGTMLTLYDQSGMYADAGVEALLFATGPVKGTGTPGVKVTDEQKAYLQERVNALQETFDAAVKHGRGFDDEQLAAVRSGAVWTADRAVGLGLLDGVKSFDEVLDEAMDLAASNQSRSAASVAIQEIVMPAAKTPKTTSTAAPEKADAPEAQTKPSPAAAEQTAEEPKTTETPEAPAASETPEAPATPAAPAAPAASETPVEAATLAELKAALPDSDAEFREQVIEGGMSLAQAKDLWLNKLDARVKDLAEENAKLKDAADQLRGHEGVEAQFEGDKTSAKAAQYSHLPSGTARFAAAFDVPGASGKATSN